MNNIYICIYLSISYNRNQCTHHTLIYTLTLYSNKEETTSTTYNVIIIYRNVTILLLIISNTYHISHYIKIIYHCYYLIYIFPLTLLL